MVNLLVIVVKTLVNLLVKLAKLRVRGATGLRGVHLGEARTISNSIIVSRPATLGVGWLRDYDGTIMRLKHQTIIDYYETIAGILLELLGILLGILPDLLGFTGNIRE